MTKQEIKGTGMSSNPGQSDTKDRKTARKQKFKHELIQYFFNVWFLLFFFGVFGWYRRFILDEYHISYLNYGTAIIEALVLAKVISIGDAIGLGRRFEDGPLIYPTIYKAFIYSCFVGVFSILEHVIGGLLRGKGVAGGWAELWSNGIYELLARSLVTFFVFIPFFTVRELTRILGEHKIFNLFFRKRSAAEHG